MLEWPFGSGKVSSKDPGNVNANADHKDPSTYFKPKSGPIDGKHKSLYNFKRRKK